MNKCGSVQIRLHYGNLRQSGIGPQAKLHGPQLFMKAHANLQVMKQHKTAYTHCTNLRFQAVMLTYSYENCNHVGGSGGGGGLSKSTRNFSV